MNSLIQLLVLAGIAVFLILRLRNVLGTREGFEKPRVTDVPGAAPARNRPDFDVIEGGPDRDIIDHVDEGSDAAEALIAMKKADSSFGVGDFLQGARGAYEMILMAFENGDLSDVRGFLSDEVAETLQSVIDDRADRGLTVEASFIGVREVTLHGARFDESTKEGDVVVRFVGELTSAVRDASGEIVEGDPNEIKRQKDVWTFSRIMGSDDPNWQLVATGE
ncbi:MAG: Tim44/TimA family putative adaptor protein [Pseudomonadota bacterium]